jgi:hypothetical protein
MPHQCSESVLALPHVVVLRLLGDLDAVGRAVQDRLQYSHGLVDLTGGLCQRVDKRTWFRPRRATYFSMGITAEVCPVPELGPRMKNKLGNPASAVPLYALGPPYCAQ